MKEIEFQIASRATILLGREGVSRSDGALVELIKNSYDADANFCFIYFDKENDRILIIDDGSGMTREIIASAWMTIGTDNKKEEFVSSKNRVKAGEKGIGRFALDRLGRVCRMYTKHQAEKLIHWEMDWGRFEKPRQTLSDVKAQYEYMEDDFSAICSKHVEDFIGKVNKILAGRNLTLNTGTLLEISCLRDNWDTAAVAAACSGLEALLPPQEQGAFDILVKQGESAGIRRIESSIQDDFDYRLAACFDGKDFKINMYRNELNVDGIPKAFFRRKAFSGYPYRLEDFEKGSITFHKDVSALLSSEDPDVVERVRQIGHFLFDVRFLKHSDMERGHCKDFHKKISVGRKEWMSRYAGIKIYRDNFAVRPYGDPASNSFDWLRLDARKSANPVAVSDKSLQWHVSNAQVQGTLFISRIHNPNIADKSSREGLIENAEFSMLCTVLKALIALFEKDRAYIEHEIRVYNDEVDKAENVKRQAIEMARRELSSRTHANQDDSSRDEESAQKNKTYAHAIKIFHKEIEELASEIKLLRALATNGLITSSLVHDLKTIKSLLVVRVESLQEAIKKHDKVLVNQNLDDLRVNDRFLKSWIEVVTEQSFADKRKRMRLDVQSVVSDAVELMRPILKRKHVNVNVQKHGRFEMKIFRIDFESIVYNLLINSIEAFVGCKNNSAVKREITIQMSVSVKGLTITYSDTGPGLSPVFKDNPYSILDYGVTSKTDKNGNKIGTGLGMYIVATNVNDYKGKIELPHSENGFLMNIIIPGEPK